MQDVSMARARVLARVCTHVLIPLRSLHPESTGFGGQVKFHNVGWYHDCLDLGCHIFIIAWTGELPFHSRT